MKRTELKRTSSLLRSPFRRTPLARGVSAAPVAGTPRQDPALPKSGKPRVRQPLNPVSRKRMKANAQRRKAEDLLRQQSLAEHGVVCCRRCGATGEVHGHEKVARAHGGDFTDPDMLLCNPCNTWCESFPILAAWQGWKTSAKHPTAPCIESGHCSPWRHQPDDGLWTSEVDA